MVQTIDLVGRTARFVADPEMLCNKGQPFLLEGKAYV